MKIKLAVIILCLFLSQPVRAQIIANPLPGTPIAASAVQTDSHSLLNTLSANPDFSTLVIMLQASGWSALLEGGDVYTIFAPTNDAFARLPPGILDTLMLPDHHLQLALLLKHHIVKGRITAASAKGTKTDLVTEAKDGLTFDGTGTEITINGAQITHADIRAKNGVIHAINRVLVQITTP